MAIAFPTIAILNANSVALGTLSGNILVIRCATSDMVGAIYEDPPSCGTSSSAHTSN